MTAEPQHLAIIMDGNGRWARHRGLPRPRGHAAGARAVREITTACRERDIRHLTLYALSTENKRRPAAEVQGLMDLLCRFLRQERATLLENGIELRAIGDLARLPARPRRLLDEVRHATAGQDGMRLTLSLAYGGRDDLVRATRRIAAALERGELRASELDEDTIAHHLDTHDLPDPDLVVRTGGEHRLSNFLLWQMAYAEFYVTDVLWPDFGGAELDRALAWLRTRERRFGRVEATAGQRSADDDAAHRSRAPTPSSTSPGEPMV